MPWWRWLAGGVQALLLLVLVLLWWDNLRERPGWSSRRASPAAGLSALVIPVGFVLVLLLPLWAALSLIAVPAVAVVAMAMAS